MTPFVTARGHSFVGAGKYYLHDKKAETTERVAFTHIHNIPTQDEEKAFRWMAYTAMHAEDLKRQAGVRATGRKSTKGHVYAYSLSWHPEEDPDHDHMKECGFETLKRLGLLDHEAVMVAHQDTAHPHLHVIVNLVDPETGKVKAPSKDFTRLSDWAEEYEKTHTVYCDQRIENNKRRRGGEYVKHRADRLDRAAVIQQLYSHSDSGKAFAAALEEQGYTLAQGDRRGFVLVDQDGQIFSLSRQLEEQRAQHIKTRLADLDRAALPDAKALADQRQYKGRDQYETDWQNRLLDAADKRARVEGEHEEGRGEEGRTDGGSGGGPQAPATGEDFDPDTYQSYAEEIDPVIEWERQAERQRQQKEAELEKFYKRREKAVQLAKLKAELAKHQGIKGKVTGRRAELEQEIRARTKTLENTDQRIAEQRRSLEMDIEAARPSGPKDTDQAPPSPANENTPGRDAEKERRAEQIRQRMREQSRRRGPGR